MENKRGITILSLVIYIVLLSVFTAIAIAVSNNLSSDVFADKGAALNISSYDKILYYLNRSAIESDSVKVDGTKITFSNGDEYIANIASSSLNLNGGILCKNVSNFTIDDVGKNTLIVTVELKKYAHTMVRTINLYLGE